MLATGSKTLRLLRFLLSGLDHTWDVDLYGELLEIGGGKERMTKYFKVGALHPVAFKFDQQHSFKTAVVEL